MSTEMNKRVQEHYRLMLRMVEGNAIYAVTDGKRTRLSLRNALRTELQAGLDVLAELERSRDEPSR